MKTKHVASHRAPITLGDLEPGTTFRFIHSYDARIYLGAGQHVSFEGRTYQNAHGTEVVVIEPYAVEDGTVLFRDVTP